MIGGNAAKRRQVDAFLRALAATLPPDDELPRPLRVVDLGCGNAYLTFAAYRYLTGRGLDVEVVGVDVREDQRVRNTALARRLGCADAGAVRRRHDRSTPTVDAGADLVLALHACDTATDEALARAVRWDARVGAGRAVLPPRHRRASCGRGPPRPRTTLLTRQGILRERFADVLTDALRAALLRSHGYRVEVVEFVDSAAHPAQPAAAGASGPLRAAAPTPNTAISWPSGRSVPGWRRCCPTSARQSWRLRLPPAGVR